MLRVEPKLSPIRQVEAGSAAYVEDGGRMSQTSRSNKARRRIKAFARDTLRAASEAVPPAAIPGSKEVANPGRLGIEGRAGCAGLIPSGIHGPIVAHAEVPVPSLDAALDSAECHSPVPSDGSANSLVAHLKVAASDLPVRHVGPPCERFEPSGGRGRVPARTRTAGHGVRDLVRQSRISRRDPGSSALAPDRRPARDPASRAA